MRSVSLNVTRAAEDLRSTDDVELDAVDEGVVGDGAGVRGAAAQRLAVGLARLADVGRGDAGERHELDVVDFESRLADQRNGRPPLPAVDVQSRNETVMRPVGDVVPKSHG